MKNVAFSSRIGVHLPSMKTSLAEKRSVDHQGFGVI